MACKILTREELRSMDSNNFWRRSGALFVSTDIIQMHLANLKLERLIPDTYSKQFAGLFKRPIEKKLAKEITEFPCFIKPVNNSKDFDGRRVYKKTDLPLPDTQVYVVPIVEMQHETRFFIGNGKIYATNALAANPPSPAFVAEVVKATGKDFFCIDVAQFQNEKKEDMDWFIVEINPPLGSGDNGCSIPGYVQFNLDYINRVSSLPL